MSDFLEISVVSYDDQDMFSDIVNQGIDSRLEAFTKSKFSEQGSRLILNFHIDELSILLRRLIELWENEGCGTAEGWADDIVQIHYGFETV